jgi:WD40 repeat protein
MLTSSSFTLPRSHDAGVIDVQFDSSGSYLASCALDGTLVVYALALQRYIHRLELDDTPSFMRWGHAVSDCFSIVVGFTSGDLSHITFKQDNVRICLHILVGSSDTWYRHQPVVTYQHLGHHTGGTVRAISQRGRALVTAAGSEIAVWCYENSEGDNLS